MRKTAIVVVDMIKDNVDTNAHFGIGEEGRKIIPKLQHLLSAARQAAMPVIFANDSFMPNDFIFQGRVKPHAIRGTRGTDVITELGPQQGDIVLEKRRFSAFFRTDLDLTLRELGVDTIAVTGIATEGCVLTTVFDGIANDFSVILLEDCCASARRSNHDAIVGIYRGSPMEPLLRVLCLEEFLREQQLSSFD